MSSQQHAAGNNHPAHLDAARANEEEFRRLAVFRGDVQVGTLTHKGHLITFTYNERAQREGLWISSRMKDTSQSYSGGPGDPPRLPSFFNNLLPSYGGKRRIDAAESLGVTQRHEFELIEIFGSEMVGNVRVETSRKFDEKHPVNIVEGRLVGEHFWKIFQEGLRVDSPGFDHYSLAGHMPKFSRLYDLQAQLQRTAVAPGLQVNLLPLMLFKIEKYQDFVALESFCLDVARDAGLTTINHVPITDDTGTKALLVERFDRYTAEDGQIKKVYVEDGCQLKGTNSDDHFFGTYQDLARVVMGAVDDPQRAGEELFRAFVLSWGVGNGDLHNKNMSIWQNPRTNEIEIAPTYDVISTYPFNPKDMRLGITVPKKYPPDEMTVKVGPEFSSKDLMHLAKDLGVSHEQAAEIAQDVSDALGRGRERLESTSLNHDLQLKLGKLFTRRGRSLDDFAAFCREQGPETAVVSEVPQL